MIFQQFHGLHVILTSHHVCNLFLCIGIEMIGMILFCLYEFYHTTLLTITIICKTFNMRENRNWLHHTSSLTTFDQPVNTLALCPDRVTLCIIFRIPEISAQPTDKTTTLSAATFADFYKARQECGNWRVSGEGIAPWVWPECELSVIVVGMPGCWQHSVSRRYATDQRDGYSALRGNVALTLLVLIPPIW